MDSKIKSLLKKIYHPRNSDYDVKSGRSVHHVPSNLTPDDLLLLHDCDLAPNTFVQIPHDIVISNIQKYASKISLAAAAGSWGATAIMPTKRSGWRRVASARMSLATGANATAVSLSMI